MRVGMIPENPLEWLLSRANAVPFPIADTLVAMLQVRAVMAANRLGVFSSLAKRPASLEELAGSLSCKERGMKSLLEALVGCGYVAESKGKYRLSARARRWLSPDSPRSVNHFLELNYLNWEWLGGLEEAIRTGISLDMHHSELLDHEGWRRYLYGLHDLSKMAAKEVSLRFRLKPSQRRLLDIGGGHGAYVAEYCRKYPDLRAVIFDLPPAIPVVQEIVERHYGDMAGRIEFVSGDLAKDPIGKGHDVVFLFNVIHHFDSDGIRQVSRTVWEALNPGGTFVILDQFKKPTRAESYFAVLTHLMFLVTSNAECAKLEDMRKWLKEAGFTNIRAKGLRIGPGTSLVIADKM